MDEIVTIISYVLVSLGGGSVIIFGLSSWLGNIWANRILDKDRMKFTKEVEEMKGDIVKELDRLSKVSDKVLHISKVQYDNEYRIYQEVWIAMIKCVDRMDALYPRGIENQPLDKKLLEEYMFEKYKKFEQSYIEFYEAISFSAPFFKKEFYDEFISIKDQCYRVGRIYYYYEFDRKYNISYAAVRDEPMNEKDDLDIRSIPLNVKQMRDTLLISIRDYLESLDKSLN